MPVSKTSTTQRKSNGSGAVSKAATKTASKVTAKATGKVTGKTAVKTSPTKAAPTKPVTKVAGKAATKVPAKKVAAQKTKPTSAPAAASDSKVTLRGRSVFIVQTTSAGVTVRTAWLSEDKTLRDMVAVFPDVNYAVTLIDDLKREVLKHFSQAAQVGARAIASQRATRAK